MPYKNAEDRAAAQKRFYDKNKPYYKKKRKQYKKQAQAWYVEHKKTLCCKICGENTPCCIDFHHKDPTTKKFAVSVGLTRGYSKKMIQEEIMKCIPLCANCHRKVHEGIINI